MVSTQGRTDNENNKFIDGIDCSAISTSTITDAFPRIATKSVTFAAATTGAVATHNLFTVTGAVAVQVIGVCSVDVTGSGTIGVGTAKTANGLIASTTGTNIDANEIWHDATPDASIEAITVLVKKICIQNISYTIATDTLTAGTVTFIVLWTPLTADGSVVAA